MRRAALALALIAGCGVRSGVDVDTPEREDSGRARRDAGGFDAGLPFDTFPCRWSLGPITELASADVVCDVGGTASAEREQALVWWSAGTCEGEGRRAAVVSLAADRAIIAEAAVPVGDRRDCGVTGATTGSGWVMASCDEVARTAVDLSVPLAIDVPLVGIVASRMERDLLLGATREGDAYAAYSLSAERVLGSTLSPPRVGDRRDVLWMGASGGEAFWREDGGALRTLPLEGDVLGFVADLLRPGLVVVLGAATAPVLVRIDAAEPALRAHSLGVVDARGEVTDVAGNETEVLLVGRDGVMYAMPTPGGRVHALTFSDAPVRTARFALQPGTSVGGIVWIEETPIGGRVRFGPLICNR